MTTVNHTAFSGAQIELTTEDHRIADIFERKIIDAAFSHAPETLTTKEQEAVNFLEKRISTAKLNLNDDEMGVVCNLEGILHGFLRYDHVEPVMKKFWGSVAEAMDKAPSLARVKIMLRLSESVEKFIVGGNFTTTYPNLYDIAVNPASAPPFRPKLTRIARTATLSEGPARKACAEISGAKNRLLGIAPALNIA